MACVNLVSLNLTPDLEEQDRGVAGRMHEGTLHKAKSSNILTRAKGILSAEQFAELKAQRTKSANAKKTET